MTRRPPTKPPATKTSQDRTPELLITAAKKVFATKGFAGTTVREIADEAGVNLSLVSYHFDGKEGLYRACIEDFGMRRLSDAERVLQTPASREEFTVRFELFIGELLKAYIEEPELTIIVQREIEQKTPIIEDIFEKTLLKVGKKLREFFLFGKSKAWIRDDFEPMVAVTMVFGSLVHAMRIVEMSEKYFGISIRQPAYREIFRKQVVAIILEGLFLPPVPAPALTDLIESDAKPKGRLQS